MQRLFASSRLARPALGRPAALSGLLALGLSALASSCSSQPDDDDLVGAGGSAVTGAVGGSTSGGAAQGGSSNAGSAGASATGQGGTMAASTGGTPGIAVAPSGGASGSGNAGPTSALCPETALFCDDFEDDALAQAPGAPWRMSVNALGSINVDEAQAFSGTKAAHVNAALGGTYARSYMALDQGSPANIFPAAAQEMYGRSMMYLQAIPNADSHWTFIQGEGLAADGTHNALYRFGGQHQNGAGLMANYETTSISTDCWDHSESVMPAGAWTCVEWRFAVATNEMQFWLNGTEIADIHVTQQGEGCVGTALDGQWIAPPAFQTLYLGWEHYQLPANPIDLWVDDVVVSTERVGCPAAQ